MDTVHTIFLFRSLDDVSFIFLVYRSNLMAHNVKQHSSTAAERLQMQCHMALLQNTTLTVAGNAAEVSLSSLPAVLRSIQILSILKYYLNT